VRILVARPPQVPSYFNAGHHLPVFQVAAYLRSHCDDHVEACDWEALNVSWKDVGDVLAAHYDVVALMNDFDAIDGLGRCIGYVRAVTPDAKIVTFGRLSTKIPRFFRRYDLDGIVATGDYETGVHAFADSIKREDRASLPGVHRMAPDGWHEPSMPGTVLDAASWEMPDTSEIPFQAYDRLYLRDENKFCGIPERRELVVPIARGCPIGCFFCEIPGREGKRERRIPFERAVEYIRESFERLPFEYASMYAPTFTLNRDWVISFCLRLMSLPRRYPWKCTTTLHHLDEELVRAMAAAGCVRISVGVETFAASGQANLPRIKRTPEDALVRLASICQAANVELNCFVVLGLPGTSAESSRETVQAIERLGCRVRPTVYAPYDLLREDMDEATVASLNRQLIPTGSPQDDSAKLYPLYFDRGATATRVTENVPRALRHAASGAPQRETNLDT
jgi:radical SAM superfamily enzyme YgiQ (UPF0313 family)